jgi:FG-GAP-like repeat/FG-GAP repeat
MYSIFRAIRSLSWVVCASHHKRAHEPGDPPPTFRRRRWNRACQRQITVARSPGQASTADTLTLGRHLPLCLCPVTSRELGREFMIKWQAVRTSSWGPEARDDVGRRAGSTVSNCVSMCRVTASTQVVLRSALAVICVVQLGTACASFSGRRDDPPRPRGDMAAGDVNGDGYQDLVLGLPYMVGEGRKNLGRAAVWLGGPGGLTEQPSLFLQEPLDGSGERPGSFGKAVAAAGDVNGDGFGDIAIGAPETGSCAHSKDSQPPLDGGRVYVYLGGPEGLDSHRVWWINGGGIGMSLGMRFEGSGDIDGDGFSDLIVVADGGGAQSCAGAPSVLYPIPSRHVLYRGSRQGLIAEDLPASRAGRIVGDVDGDGRAELIPHPVASASQWFVPGLVISADLNQDRFEDVIFTRTDLRRGRLFVRMGSQAGLSDHPAVSAIGPLLDMPGVPPVAKNIGFLSQTSYGDTLVATDIDGDGYPDVVVGASRAHSIYVYAGSPSGVTPTIRQVITGEKHIRFIRLAAGDFDRDGHGDLAALTYGNSGRQDTRSPELMLFRGSAKGLEPSPSITVSLEDLGGWP